MFNLHSDKTRGEGIDAVLKCVENHQQGVEVTHEDVANCRSISNPIAPLSSVNNEGVIVPGVPAAIVMEPIFPTNNDTTVVGFTSFGMNFGSVLQDMLLTDSVSGLDIVFGANDVYWTFTAYDGIVKIRANGDQHDRKYTKCGQSASLLHDGLYNASSVPYTIAMYPTDAWFDTYRTSNPLIATIGSVCVIVLTSLLFILYDNLVHREYKERLAVLEAKRQFVRFISHEVRTPLNTVCMGLKLMYDELSEYGQELQQPQTGPLVLSKDHPHIYPQKQCILNWMSLTQEISDSAHNAVCVLNDVLNYDKIETRTLTVDIATVAFGALLVRTLKEFQPQADEAKITLQFEYAQYQHEHRNQSQLPVQRALAQPQRSSTNTEAECEEAVLIGEGEEVGGGVAVPGVDVEMGRGYQAMVGAEPEDDKDMPLEDMYVMGDDIRLTQVLRNLISNALKFTPSEGTVAISAKWDRTRSGSIDDGGGGRTHQHDQMDEFTLTGSGEVVSFRRRGSLVVAVRDRGVGMTAEQVSQVFHEEGVQFNVNELQGGNGSGLGMYIAKGIVELHGGSLVAASEGLGKGCSFTMNLPLYEVPNDSNDVTRTFSSANDIESSVPAHRHTTATVEHQVGHNTEVAPISAPSSQFQGNSIEQKKLHVLVVDDAASNRKMLTRLLRNKGHMCEEAKDGQEAVDLVTSRRELLLLPVEQNEGEHGPSPNDSAAAIPSQFQCILMDYEMPVMNGPTATQKLRDMGCDVMIIGITGNLLPEDVHFFKECGADDVLPKPLKLVDLESTWRKLSTTRERALEPVSDIDKTAGSDGSQIGLVSSSTGEN